MSVTTGGNNLKLSRRMRRQRSSVQRQKQRSTLLQLNQPRGSTSPGLLAFQPPPPSDFTPTKQPTSQSQPNPASDHAHQLQYHHRNHLHLHLPRHPKRWRSHRPRPPSKRPLSPPSSPSPCPPPRPRARVADRFVPGGLTRPGSIPPRPRCSRPGRRTSRRPTWQTWARSSCRR